MPNRVSILPDGIIYFVFEGDQDGVTVVAVMDEIMRCVNEISGKGKKILLLGNIERSQKHDSAARKAGLRMAKEMRYDRIAMFGGTWFTRGVAKLVIKAADDKRIKFFDSRDAAEKWLKELL